jgi:hypothetical protein
MDQQLGAIAAMNSARRSMLSARPDAPVIPERPARWQTASTAVRYAGARALHGLATRIEPRQGCLESAALGGGERPAAC